MLTSYLARLPETYKPGAEAAGTYADGRTDFGPVYRRPGGCCLHLRETRTPKVSTSRIFPQEELQEQGEMAEDLTMKW